MSPTNGCPAPPSRLAALRRFAVAITVLNVLGHTVLGFEQSWAQPLVALATAYGLELLLETMGAWADRRPCRFVSSPIGFIDFLLPAHISGLAVSMLLYANDRLLPIAFAAAVAIGSKALVRVTTREGTRHCLNPSNTGIAITLLVFPWVGIAPPYQFAEGLTGIGDWLLPLILVLAGTFLNTRFTFRLPLIVGWLGGFVIQAVVRSQVGGTSLIPALLPMTGVAFLLFTFYMVSDPATTPRSAPNQFLFGVGVAAAYGMLMALHIVFGLFFSLLLVCSVRGVALALQARWELAPRPQVPVRVRFPTPVHAGAAVAMGEAVER